MDSQRPVYCTAYEASVRIGCALEDVHALFTRRGDYAVLEEQDLRYRSTTRRMLVPAGAVEEVAAQYQAAKAAFFGGASAPEPKQEAMP